MPQIAIAIIPAHLVLTFWSQSGLYEVANRDSTHESAAFSQYMSSLLFLKLFHVPKAGLLSSLLLAAIFEDLLRLQIVSVGDSARMQRYVSPSCAVLCMSIACCSELAFPRAKAFQNLRIARQTFLSWTSAPDLTPTPSCPCSPPPRSSRQQCTRCNTAH